MTGAAALLSTLFLVVALVDWMAVGTRRKTLELAAKPATLVMLILVTLALEPDDPTVRTWFVVALVFGLAGDVFLMLEERFFVFGLASFLVGHLAYVVGFVIGGVERSAAAAGVAVVVLGLTTVGVRVVRAVSSGDDPKLVGPVVAYVGVISVMVVVAFGSGSVLAAAGAILFYASDALIAWTRFVQDYPWGRVAIIVTYHLGQFGIVLSLVW